MTEPTLTPEDRRVLDHLVRLINSGKAGFGRIRPMWVVGLDLTAEPPTIDLQVLGTNTVLDGRRFFSGTPVAVGELVYVWQEGRDCFVLGAPTSIANSGWMYVGNPGQPTFVNNWANFGGTLQTVGFRRVGDEVQLRGAAKSNGAGAVNASTVFTLPVGYRPRFDDGWPVYSPANAYVAVYTSGIVQYLGANNPTYLGLSSVRFSVS